MPSTTTRDGVPKTGQPRSDGSALLLNLALTAVSAASSDSFVRHTVYSLPLRKSGRLDLSLLGSLWHPPILAISASICLGKPVWYSSDTSMDEEAPVLTTDPKKVDAVLTQEYVAM
jgi:hypothetical protein